MSETKYGKYILSKWAPWPDDGLQAEEVKMLLRTGDALVPSSDYFESGWLKQGVGSGKGSDPHIHEFDEMLGFIGNNTEDPEDLCAEIDIYLGGEKHVLTKSSVIFVPP